MGCDKFGKCSKILKIFRTPLRLKPTHYIFWTMVIDFVNLNYEGAYERYKVPNFALHDFAHTGCPKSIEEA